MILTPPQVNCFRNGQKVCREVLPKLEWLEKIAEVAPEYKDRVQEIREMHDHLNQLCECALSVA